MHTRMWGEGEVRNWKRLYKEVPRKEQLDCSYRTRGRCDSRLADNEGALRDRVEALSAVASRRALLVAKSETTPLALDLGAAETGHDLGHLDVRHLLDVATSEDDVDLLERATGRLGVEKVNDREAVEQKRTSQRRTHFDEMDTTGRTSTS